MGWHEDRTGHLWWLDGRGRAHPHIGADMSGARLVGGSPWDESMLRAQRGPLVKVTD